MKLAAEKWQRDLDMRADLANENDVSESRAGVGSNGANENYADTNRDGHSDDEFAKSRTAFPFRLSF